MLGLASVLAFFLFLTSEPNSKESGRENQRSEAGEAGNPSQKAVAGNEVEGEKGQGASEGWSYRDWETRSVD